jgi:hypothetical protein
MSQSRRIFRFYSGKRRDVPHSGGNPMKWIVCLASTALALTTLSAGAAPARDELTAEKSPDVLNPALAKKAPRAVVPLVLAPSLVSAAAAPTPEDVGDADSFQRNVTYLGLAQTLGVTLVDDCTGSDPALERCIVQNAAPASTTFDESGLATMNLPAKATKSLMCFALTPFITVSWNNFTASPQTARFTAQAVITIDNEVLDDPTLIDPGTGLPFGGSVTLALSTWRNFHSIQPGEFEQESSTQSRNCIAGIISKRSLVENYGLTDTQATQFFKKPMTLTFGARGTVSMSDFTSYFYGIRLYGD